jgi:hypothetical protein
MGSAILRVCFKRTCTARLRQACKCLQLHKKKKKKKKEVENNILKENNNHRIWFVVQLFSFLDPLSSAEGILCQAKCKAECMGLWRSLVFDAQLVSFWLLIWSLAFWPSSRRFLWRLELCEATDSQHHTGPKPRAGPASPCKSNRSLDKKSLSYMLADLEIFWRWFFVPSSRCGDVAVGDVSFEAS